jgi:hypothetical protein
MTEFTQEHYRQALASIASGEVTQCVEHSNELEHGLFKTLYRAGFIRGREEQTLNRFVLVDVGLTPQGRACLTSFS